MSDGPPAALPDRRRPVVLATRNPGKAVELEALLAEVGIRALDLGAAGVPYDPVEEAVEIHGTFAANAAAKARYYAARVDGLPVIADDSGLEVVALGAEPGVRSRRFSGVDGSRAEVDAANNRELLRRLEGVADRRAAFVCAMCWIDGSAEVAAEGRVRGQILTAPAVGAHGFGYDPLFRSDELGRTFAEATRDEKAAVSHRGRALRALVSALRLTPPTDPDTMLAASGA